MITQSSEITMNNESLLVLRLALKESIRLELDKIKEETKTKRKGKPKGKIDVDRSFLNQLKYTLKQITMDLAKFTRISIVEPESQELDDNITIYNALALCYLRESLSIDFRSKCKNLFYRFFDEADKIRKAVRSEG